MFEKMFMLESSFYICMLDSREVKVDIPSMKNIPSSRIDHWKPLWTRHVTVPSRDDTRHLSSRRRVFLFLVLTHQVLEYQNYRIIEK